MSDSEYQSADDNTVAPPRELVSPSEYRNSLKRGREADQYFVLEQRLDELLRAIPDKAIVETIRDRLFQVMSGLGNVASKDNMIVMSQLIEAIQTEVRSIGKTVALNERDVTGLKDGQAAIRQQNDKLSAVIAERTKEIDARIDNSLSGVKEALATAKTDLNDQTTALRQTLKEQTAEMKADQEKQTENLGRELKDAREAITALKLEMATAQSRIAADVAGAQTAGMRYLFTAMITILVFLMGVGTFVYTKWGFERPTTHAADSPTPTATAPAPVVSPASSP